MITYLRSYWLAGPALKINLYDNGCGGVEVWGWVMCVYCPTG